LRRVDNDDFMDPQEERPLVVGLKVLVCYRRLLRQ